MIRLLVILAVLAMLAMITGVACSPPPVGLTIPSGDELIPWAWRHPRPRPVESNEDMYQ